jgi:hypothetical protein
MDMQGGLISNRHLDFLELSWLRGSFLSFPTTCETPRVTHQNEIGERNLPHKLLIPNFMRPVWR